MDTPFIKNPPHTADPPLLRIPPDIRLVLYDILFAKQDSTQSASEFLLPLLTCRQIYQEAHQIAYRNAEFALDVAQPNRPYFAPAILTLPYSIRSFVRTLTVTWSISIETKFLRRFFAEIQHSAVRLDTLEFRVSRNQHMGRYADRHADYPRPLALSLFFLERLPLLRNVKKIVLLNPGVVDEGEFTALFDPDEKRWMQWGPYMAPGCDEVDENLGCWEYSLVEWGDDIMDWTLEMTHPGGGDGCLGSDGICEG